VRARARPAAPHVPPHSHSPTARARTSDRREASPQRAAPAGAGPPDDPSPPSRQPPRPPPAPAGPPPPALPDTSRLLCTDVNGQSYDVYADRATCDYAYAGGMGWAVNMPWCVRGGRRSTECRALSARKPTLPTPVDAPCRWAGSDEAVNWVRAVGLNLGYTNVVGGNGNNGPLAMIDFCVTVSYQGYYGAEYRILRPSSFDVFDFLRAGAWGAFRLAALTLPPTHLPASTARAGRPPGTPARRARPHRGCALLTRARRPC
jgi:hypothetical protein